MERSQTSAYNNIYQEVALHLRSYCQLSDNLIDDICDNCVLKQYRKEETIINEGSKVNMLFLVVEGICASFYDKEDGKDSICNFRKEGDFFDLPHALFAEEKSYVSVKAITNTTILCIDRKYYYSLKHKHPEFNLLTQKVSEASAIDKEWHYYFIRRYKALERIHIAETDSRLAEIMERVPDRIFASYLNMAPETYSSLRKQLRLAPAM